MIFTFLDFVNIIKRYYINLVRFHRRIFNNVYTATIPFQSRVSWSIILLYITLLFEKNVTKSLTWRDETLLLLICKTSPRVNFRAEKLYLILNYKETTF